jgi:hypothetical protein
MGGGGEGIGSSAVTDQETFGLVHLSIHDAILW